MIHGTRQIHACRAEGETVNTNNFVGQFTPMLCWPTWFQMFLHAHILPHPGFERRTRQLVPLKSTFLSYRSNSWFQVKNNRYSCYVLWFWPNPKSLGISIFRVAPKPQTLGKGACKIFTISALVGIIGLHYPWATLDIWILTQIKSLETLPIPHSTSRWFIIFATKTSSLLMFKCPFKI